MSSTLPRSHPEKWSLSRRISSIITSCFEHLLFCGIIFGWPSLAYVYKDVCYFLDDGSTVSLPLNSENAIEYTMTCQPSFGLTPTPNITDPDILTQFNAYWRDQQDLELTEVGSYSVLGFILCGFLCGILYDKIGTRYYRFSMLVLYAIGCAIFSQATRDKPYLLLFAGPLVQIGGMTQYSTNMKVPSLIPKYEGTLTQLLNGALEASAATFLVAKVAYDNGFWDNPTTFWYTWLAICIPFMAIRTGFLMPKFQFIDKYSKNIEIDQAMKTIETEIEQQPIIETIIDKTPELTFLDHLKMPKYWIHIYWMAVLDFWNIYFMMNFNSWSSWLTNESQDRISFYINLWALAQFLGAPFAMFVGFIYDKCRNKTKKTTGDEHVAALRATSIVIFITCGLAVISSFLTSQKVEWYQYIMMACQLTFRACLYGNNVQALLTLYPKSMFGKLYGFTMGCTAFGPIITPKILKYIQTNEDNSFARVNLLIMCFILTSLSYPIYLYRLSKRV